MRQQTKKKSCLQSELSALTTLRFHWCTKDQGSTLETIAACSVCDLIYQGDCGRMTTSSSVGTASCRHTRTMMLGGPHRGPQWVIGSCGWADIGIKLMSRGCKVLSPFHTCTVSLSWLYPDELDVRTQMSNSVGPDIKHTLPCKLPSAKTVWCPTEPACERSRCPGNSQRVSGRVVDVSIRPLEEQKHEGSLVPD